MRLPMLPLLIACLTLAACGGAPGGPISDPPPDPGSDLDLIHNLRVVMKEIPVLESYSLVASSPFARQAIVWVGDSGAPTSMNEEYMGFWRFDVEAHVPPGARILSATFETVRRDCASCGNPELRLYIMLDDMGDTPMIGGSAFYGSTLAHGFDRLRKSGELLPGGEVYGADVTERLQAAVDAQRTHLNLRARWMLPVLANGALDAYVFDMPADGLPMGTLKVTYRY